MDNKVYLNQLKTFYDALKPFDIQNNYLILYVPNLQKNFILPLNHTDLTSIPKEIFLSSPSEIFHFLQMHELLYKTELTEKEINYIKDFTNKYLELKNNNNDGKMINDTTLWCLELLISKSYEEKFINNPASKLVISIIDNFNKELESGLGIGVKLVLTKTGNQNFNLEEDIDTIKTFEKAGFTTLLLVIITVVLTCMFIAFFIIGN